jgi:DNA-binding CsgD family transcriptional regulator
MDKKIIIVHRSEIIRKGLAAIIRQKYTGEMAVLCDQTELDEQYNECVDTIIFAEQAHISVEKFKHSIHNPAKIVWISSCTSASAKNNETSSLNIYANQEDIHELIFRLWKGNTDDARNQVQDLSSREQDVLKLVALGHSNKEIADMLFISIHTVISHRKNITEKLGIKSISGLTVYAVLNKLIDTDNIDLESFI